MRGARVVRLNDADPQFGPYLFEVIDPDLPTDRAASELGRIVREVKDRLPEEYQWDDLIEAIRKDGLGVVELAGISDTEEVW